MKWTKQAFGGWRDGAAWGWLLTAAGLLAIVFVAALHPATGILGGIFVTLASWAVPSALNILVSAAIISFFPASYRRPPVLMRSFAVVSLLLALAPEAPMILQRVVHPPRVQYRVIRAVSVPSGTTVRPTVPICRSGFPAACNLYVVANPLAEVIDMGGDEGCGCSYWVLPDTRPTSTTRSYLDYLTEDIQRQMVEGHESHWVPDFAILVAARPNEQDPTKADLSIEIHDGGMITATLTEQAIPRYRRAFIESDRAPLLNGHFAAIAIHGLIHGTFWSQIVGRYFGFYPRGDVRRFLKEAIVVHSPAKANLEN
jgi:hypothetical protein